MFDNNKQVQIENYVNSIQQILVFIILVLMNKATCLYNIIYVEQIVFIIDIIDNLMSRNYSRTGKKKISIDN